MSGPGPQRLERREPDDRYDEICNRGNLTRRQLLIWAGDRRAAGAPVFTEAGLFHIRGRVDPASFQRAFQAVLDEADALRMIVDDVDGWPRQRVVPSAASTAELVDLSSVSAPAGALEALARERVATSVNGHGPLIDSVLVRIRPEHHVWVLAQHQLISDAWSFRLIHQRMVEHYERDRRGLGGAGVVRPQFQEYLAHERRYRASPQYRAARAYWQSRCPSPAVRTTTLDSGVARDATKVCRVSRRLGHATTAALRRLAAAQSAAVDVGLFSIFASLVIAHLYRTSGTDDVLLSVPFANRPSQRFKHTVGSFMNVCPVRVVVERGDTFSTLLRQVEREVWEAARHQGYAMRPVAGSQPYDVLVNVHKEAVRAHTFGDMPLEVAWLPPTHRFGALAVAVQDFSASDNLTLDLDFNEATFGRASREDISRRMLRMLDDYLADPERKLGARPSNARSAAKRPASRPDGVADPSAYQDDTGSGSAPCGPGAGRFSPRTHDSDGLLGAGRVVSVVPAGQRPKPSVPPRTDVEREVAAIWCALLEVPAVGLDDDFFELGGDSLLAYRMLVRVGTAFRVESAAEWFFASPTVAGVVAAIAAARVDAAPVTESALPEPRTARGRLQALPRRAGVNTFRASFAQERLWFLEQVASGRAVANVAGAFHAVGRLDLPALRRSLEALVARHESLRTTLATVEGAPLQVISPFATVSMAVVDRRDVEGATDGERGARVRADLTLEVERPFDVAHGPLLRVTVFRLADDTQIVCVTMHHLIADAWSVTIVVRELTALYRAFLGEGSPRLPRAELQYADYAQWQRARLQGERRERLAAYWRHQLRGAPYLAVATDEGQRDHLSGRGAARTCEVPAALAEAARALGRRQGVTLFVVALAAWQALVSRWTGCDDVTVLSPIANRERPEVAEMIGFFVNLVALRTRLEGDPRFRALLERVKDVVRGAHLHQELPFEMVLKELELDRTLTRPPLSPIAFALERAPVATITWPDVELSAVELDTTTSKTDLALILCEHDGGMTARLEYNRDLFDADTIARLLREFVTCLERAVTDPERRLSELRTRPSPSLAVPAGAGGETVWERFLAQAARTPEAVAVRAGTEVLTYRALAARAAGIAAALAARGVGPGVIVGVWGERGVGLLSAMLGIFRVDAAYLPLDPRAPAARLAQLLRQSGARVVLTGPQPPAALVAAQAVAAPWALVPLGAEVAAVVEAAAAGTRPAERHRASDLAYVMYTSGSTGEPKGAMIEQAGLLNHLEAKIALLELGAGDRVAQTASAGFDISLWQYLAVLLVGGRVEVVGDAAARDPRRLRAMVARAGVTVLETVPAVLRLLLEADALGEGHALGGLRWLVVTGEALAPALCRQWLRRYPTIPLVNAYGPTECADDVTHHVVRTPPPAGAVRVPIGRPIANMAVHVLDAALAPVGEREVGELCVGGIGVGRGYLHDPERTAAAFVPDPFDGRPGARLYRTGDRGRRLPDGSLECLGRLDQQVKIRGMRIEPGEIEAVLVQHPAVRQAVVVARIDRGADARLVAYVAALDPPPALLEALRRFLAERLPDFMVPSLFVVLAALPLSANGKIDRHALPEPVGRRTDPTVVSRGPETAIERLLMDIWSEVLGVDVTSVDDGFLALGGDSLSSLRVVAEARQHGIVVTPTQLFEQQTIARLAAVATTAVGPRADQDLVSGAVELTPVQRMFFDADLPAVHHYNMAVLLEVPDDLAPSLLAIAVEHLLRHHDALRLRFRRDAEGWQQSIAGLDGVVPFSHVELSSQADGAVQPAIAAVANELQASLNLADGPIIRVALFGFGPDRPGRVLIVIHHLACDIVSWPILLADLASLYDGLGRGDAIALPPKTSSYQQWARRLLEYGRRPDHAHELDFWRRECADPGARLPRDLPGPDATIADLEHVRSVLAPAQTQRVCSVAAAAGVSVEVVLLTALAMAVTERAGGDALLVYLERHGREALFPDLDVARTVGWFTAVFPVRLRVAPSRRPEETLRLIARHLTEIPSGGVGYGVMRYADHDSNLTAALRALPRPEVSFNYLGRIDPPERARWRLARESPGREFSMRGARPTILDVTARVADGGLHVAWAYGAALHRRATIEQLAGRFLDVIMQIGRGTS